MTQITASNHVNPPNTPSIGALGYAMGTSGTNLNSLFNNWTSPVKQEEDINLKKISDTCKLLNLEKYDPAKFVNQLKDLHRFIHAAYMNSTGQFGLTFNLPGINPLKEADDLIGRMLLSFDKETADETIEKACNE